MEELLDLLEEEKQKEEFVEMNMPQTAVVPMSRETVGEPLVRQASSVDSRAGNASVQRNAVGDLTEKLLEHAGELWVQESRASAGMEIRSGTEWAVFGRNRQEETAAERLYGKVNTAWLRQTADERRDVVVAVRENDPGTALSVRDVDRAFQRDARRYDGGLHLL